MEQLLVAEVLDDVGVSAERTTRRCDLDIEVLGPDTDGELGPGEVLEARHVAVGQRDVDAITLELTASPVRVTSTSRKFIEGEPMNCAAKSVAGRS